MSEGAAGFFATGAGSAFAGSAAGSGAGFGSAFAGSGAGSTFAGSAAGAGSTCAGSGAGAGSTFAGAGADSTFAGSGFASTFGASGAGSTFAGAGFGSGFGGSGAGSALTGAGSAFAGAGVVTGAGRAIGLARTSSSRSRSSFSAGALGFAFVDAVGAVARGTTGAAGFAGVGDGLGATAAAGFGGVRTGFAATGGAFGGSGSAADGGRSSRSAEGIELGGISTSGVPPSAAGARTVTRSGSFAGAAGAGGSGVRSETTISTSGGGGDDALASAFAASIVSALAFAVVSPTSASTGAFAGWAGSGFAGGGASFAGGGASDLGASAGAGFGASTSGTLVGAALLLRVTIHNTTATTTAPATKRAIWLSSMRVLDASAERGAPPCFFRVRQRPPREAERTRRQFSGACPLGDSPGGALRVVSRRECVRASFTEGGRTPLPGHERTHE